MIFRNQLQRPAEGGFALVLTVIVVAIVLAIGLSILELSIKEIRLSTLSEGSEVAFHAANAGLECARYWRRTAGSEFESGDNGITTNCFGSDASVGVSSIATENGNGNAWQYEFAHTWGAGGDRCSDVDMVVIVSPTDSTATVTQSSLAPLGYPYNEDFGCRAGGRCTLAFVQGFSNSCSTIDTVGTIQREVLLRF